MMTAGAVGGGGGPRKAAVAATGELPIVKLHVAPLHIPLHVTKVKPPFGVSESVIGVPFVKFAVQVPGQLIPAGALVIVPPPVGVMVTVTEFVATGAKVAVTDTGELPIVSPQPPEPPQTPPQPTKVLPIAGVSVSTMGVPFVKLAEHIGVQAIPAGLDVTDPEPVMETVKIPEDVPGAGFPAKTEAKVVRFAPGSLPSFAAPLQAPAAIV